MGLIHWFIDLLASITDIEAPITDAGTPLFAKGHSAKSTDGLVVGERIRVRKRRGGEAEK